MTLISLIIALFSVPAQSIDVVVVTTTDFEAIWVPEGVNGPIVAAPFDQQIF